MLRATDPRARDLVRQAEQLGTRLIPTDDGEAATGMKIYGIRRSSILGRLGLQNGDVLGNVNGQSMGSADALIQAYQSLGRSGTFSVSVTRRGQPMTINYQVQ